MNLSELVDKLYNIDTVSKLHFCTADLFLIGQQLYRYCDTDQVEDMGILLKHNI